MRTVGYEHTDIISKSERFFKICDEATGLAEVYAQRKATSLATLEKFITADIVVLMLLIGYEFIKAVRFAAMNRILRHKAYLDNATGLPNKNKCEEILGELNQPEDIIVCSFDLNNLRRINDSMGHDAGDAYIYRFAVCLRSSIPSEHFVGRLGGDEFIAVLQGLDKQAVRKLFEDLRKDIAAESKEHREIPLSYAAGFAMASDYPGKTMRELFNDADKNMYINKNHVKREEALEEKLVELSKMDIEETEPAVRTALNKYGRDFLPLWHELMMAVIQASEDITGISNPAKVKHLLTLKRLGTDILARGDCFTIKDLDISGNDLIEYGLQGHEIGETLKSLLDIVIENPKLNDKATLIAMIEHIK